MSNVLRHAYLSYKGQFLWLTWPGYISNVVIRPVLLLALFAIAGKFALGGEMARAYILGMSLYPVPLLMMAMTQTFHHDIRFGTFSITLGTPANRFMVYGNRAVFHVPNTILAVVVSLLFAKGFLDLETFNADWGAVILAVAVVIFSSAAFALFMGNIIMLLRDWVGPFWIAVGLIMGLSGAIVPLDSLPAALEALGRALPLTHSLEVYRNAFDGNGPAVYPGLLRELAVGLGYLGAGHFFFLGVLAKMRRDGSLSAIDS